MNNKIITTLLTLTTILGLSCISVKIQANELNDLFLSTSTGKVIALNYLRGKPPYNRASKNRQRAQKRQYSVEMSAMEITKGSNDKPSNNSRGYRGGHPDRSKKYNQY